MTKKRRESKKKKPVKKTNKPKKQKKMKDMNYGDINCKNNDYCSTEPLKFNVEKSIKDDKKINPKDIFENY